MAILEIYIQVISLMATIAGIYLISEKRKSGFLLYVISLMCQVFLFYKSQYWFLVGQMVLLITLNIWTYFKWKKGEGE